MKTLIAALLLVSSIVLPAQASRPLRHTQDRPNIVVILADDFGSGSLNAYGAPKELVRTPGIDRLAENGMRFTNANTPGAVCSPTRYALLTGRYAWRGKLKYGVVNAKDPLLVESDRETMGSFLKKQGYQTAMIGKWHLGYGEEKPVDFTEKLSSGPHTLGFDYHFGVPQNLDDLLKVYIEDDGVYGLRSKKMSPYAKSFYGKQYLGFDAPQRERTQVTETLTDRAIDWIKASHRQNPDTPLFLYFAPVSVHHPIVPSETMRGASNCGAYGDFIQDLDLSVGRLVEAMEYEGIADNTLFLFTADNGGDIPTDPARPEVQAREAGLLANGIQRGDKHTIYEGGVRVPLIARWDGHIEAGSVTNSMVNIVDIFATLAEVTTGKEPKQADTAPDSVSFLPTLLDRSDRKERSPMISSSAAGLLALRSGKWKYIEGKFPEGIPQGMQKGAAAEDAEPALYDLAGDPGETTNLIAQHPEVVLAMQAELDKLRSQ